MGAKKRAPVVAPDMECTQCGRAYFSGEGHPTSPLCGRCVLTLKAEWAALVLGVDAVDVPATGGNHQATVYCGDCGRATEITLGLASAIACPGCRTVITLGEAQ